MGQRAGYIPAAVGGHKVHLAHSGFTFTPDAEAMRRWRGWWRIVRADQWGVFFAGALLGMVLPALLYVTFLPHGSDIRGLGISAALADGIGARSGPLLAGAIAFLGAWILFKTQLDSLEGMVRAITDILWTGSRRLRSWGGGDVRRVYYGVLAAVVLWGIVALRLAPADHPAAARRERRERGARRGFAAPALPQHSPAPAGAPPARLAPRCAGRHGAVLRIVRRALGARARRILIAAAAALHGASRPPSPPPRETALRRSPPASGSAASGDSWERSCSHAKNRTNARRRSVPCPRIVPRSTG